MTPQLNINNVACLALSPLVVQHSGVRRTTMNKQHVFQWRATAATDESEDDPSSGYAAKIDISFTSQSSSFDETNVPDVNVTVSATIGSSPYPESTIVDSDEATISSSSSSSYLLMKRATPHPKRKSMELMWCDANVCKDDLRERSTEGGRIVMRGPATGQVAYHWMANDDNEITPTDMDDDTDESFESSTANQQQQQQCVLFLVKQGTDIDTLLTICADAVNELTAKHGSNIGILLDPSTAARLQHYHGVNGQNIHLFEAKPCRGFGDNVLPEDVLATEFDSFSEPSFPLDDGGSGGGSPYSNAAVAYANYINGNTNNSNNNNNNNRSTHRLVPNLIVTIGGDGLLMHAGMLFQGPMPPILCVAGGSLGFLTPFGPAEMVPAIELSLGLVGAADIFENTSSKNPMSESSGVGLQVFPPNMLTYPYEEADRDMDVIFGVNDENDDGQPSHKFNFPFGVGNVICLSIRMRLDCRIITREGVVKARYNVLNEVVVDRGFSPYLAALECFCDDAHLTTVQADGVIFATPTGSTAYSLAAGSSVVHPAVPCILLTPICPHVLSFRSMVFPDHVVLRCFVPLDARAEASVAFDGKHRQELHRGESVQIQMSAHPVPTINRKDHSADWLGSLKRSFNFNARPRQRPL